MKELPKISDAEWQVMKVLWEKSPLKAIDIINKLSEVANWQPKTIKTLIRRLIQKKAVDFFEDGKYYLYFPIVKEDECIKLENTSFLNKVYSGSFSLMVSTFLKEKNLSQSEIEELKNILDQNVHESED